MDKSQNGQEDRVTARRNLNSSKSDQTDKKKTFLKCALSLFKRMSLVEYRTPLYFANQDSYKSGTSGFLTILSGLTLAIIFLYIFVPIFKKEIYKSEIKQIDIRGEYLNGTVQNCTTICRNFSVQDALNYTFNGNLMLVI
jgi:hypothetical protein